ncbi:hypothetical protein NLI96_g11623 [Meripilus lineatus]|uniref:Uncharacterized protein n=1 Tax=Meripilus lineatus TaxID=2056292 RepID=A0AAD5URG4_9APHY|nr:hypothetical protein NLI96_g11623 [Physisporinus lineatus]
MSPPLVTSPPLQAQLFFGPVPNAVASLDLNTTGSSPPTKNAVQDAQECTKTPNKLQTSREPPLLPFPSSDAYSPPRQKLAKTRSPTTSPQQSKSPSDGAVAPPLSPSDRCGALEKVDGILARGWSQRELRGNKSLDPNMFGALPVSRTGEWGGDVLGGIDERLEQMGS